MRKRGRDGLPIQYYVPSPITLSTASEQKKSYAYGFLTRLLAFYDLCAYHSSLIAIVVVFVIRATPKPIVLQVIVTFSVTPWYFSRFDA
jgi:hypothetical protein